jgi:acetyl-CoA carboxylase/biotin carboxylase 1
LTGRTEALLLLIEQPTPILPLALHVFQSKGNSAPGLRSVAMEVYIRRIYRSYDLVSLECTASTDTTGSLLKFEFRSPEDATMLVKSGSSNNLSALLARSPGEKGSDSSTTATRTGVFATFDTYEALENNFDKLVNVCGGSANAQNVLHLAILDNAMGGRFEMDLALKPAEQRLADRLATIITSNASNMTNSGIRRVTFVIMHAPRGIDGGMNAKSTQYDFDYRGKRASIDAQVDSMSMATSGGINEEENSPYDNDPGIFTFRRDQGFTEDSLIRDLEPTLAFRLELERMSNFNVNQVFSRNRAIHVYQASDRDAQPDRRGRSSHRFFVRALVRDDTVSLALAVAQSKTSSDSAVPPPKVVGEVLNGIVSKAHPGPESRFVDCLDALEVAISDLKPGSIVYGNHIFLNMLPAVVVRPEYVQQVCFQLSQRYADRIRQLGVTTVEFRMDVRSNSNENAPKIPVRLIASNPTGYVLKVETYVEITDPKTGGITFNVMTPEMTAKYEKFTESKAAMSPTSSSAPSKMRKMVSGGHYRMGSVDGNFIGSKFAEEWMQGALITTPYPVSNPIEKNRQTASRITDTIYCYDYMALMERAVGSAWKQAGRNRPKGALFDAVELIIPASTNDGADPDALTETKRPPGLNNIGMVAWLITMKTPEAPPEGRQMVLIANDITFKAGSFGTREDELFRRASAYARKRGLPRVYSAANSGARIGMATEVRDCFKVKWNDPEDFSKGFEYLYLEPEDQERIEASVITKRITVPIVGSDEKEVRYVITDVIGAGSDLGVENLRGSGTIAGETSRAYKDIFTLTYVTGRCVGIGAYLVRLGQRTIQKETAAPILLTGFQALNKLMGKAVYTSNQQLGGPDIMYQNGVSHSVVSDDYQGVREILRWLSYVPIRKEGPLPILYPSDLGDTPDRSIEVKVESKTPQDPRILLAGYMRGRDGPGDGFDSTEWVAGFFDRESFHETMAGWAKTVVTGRARLGGIPVGVIMTEERTMQKTQPADPASPTSTEVVSNQAGQVWFPDSAHKTATAVNDFAGEELPLMIFANWRGFSGGKTDMYNEVLKFGAQIVDALVDYTHPVFVYLPPYATLRGGAWAVLDPTINAEVMEMYADPRARGGVLEPAGIVSIKYRNPDLIKTANRLDHVLRSLQAKLSIAKRANSKQEITTLETSIAARQKAVLGTYLQIATHFADLHDTPGRMLAKEVINGTVPWRRARSFFYWRLRRRLAEFALRKHVLSQIADKTKDQCGSLIKQWFLESQSKSTAAVSSQPAWKQYAFSGNSFNQTTSGGSDGKISSSEDMK